MPPFSRGLLLLRRSSYRNSTLCIPFQLRSITLPAPTRKPPSLPKASKPKTSHPQVEEPSPWSTPPSKPQSSIRRLLAHLNAQWRPTARFLFRIALWLPPALLLLQHSQFQVMWVQGASMSPYLNTHWSNDEPNTQDCVLVSRLRYLYSGRKAKPVEFERGMLIVFNTPHNPDRVAVKRIVGLPGDRIQPLPGYAGGPDAVVVPWNHLWVEGDVDNRDKSIDSNWYGPISKNLVIGRVTHVLGPWWWPTPVEWKNQSFPAQSRVEKDAVQQVHPDAAAWKEAYYDSGMGYVWLNKMRNDGDSMEKEITSPNGLSMLQLMLQSASSEAERKDPDTLPLATNMVGEIQKWLVRAAEQQKAAEESAARIEKEVKQEEWLKKKKPLGKRSLTPPVP